MEGFDDIEYGRDTDSTRYLKDDGTRYRLGQGHAELHIGAAAHQEASDVGGEMHDDPFSAEVWRLWVDEGRSMREIALELGCSLKKVWTRVQRVDERRKAARLYERLDAYRRGNGPAEGNGDKLPPED